MKLLLLGATGGTGRSVLKEAKALGHDVTVFVRDRSKLLPEEQNDTRVVTGALPEDEKPLAEAMRGQDAVISALGRGKSFKSENLIQRAVPVILRAMAHAGVRRLIFTSAFGIGETWRDTPFVSRLFARSLLRGVYADKTLGEALIRQSDLDWTIVHPTMLTDGPRTGTWRSGERLALVAMPKISRGDAGAFLVSQLNDSSYVRKTVLVSY
jgi:putative NADH-flavin reductase